MAHVLVLTLVFPPDAVSTAQIVGEMAIDLHALGHQVSVVTTTPHYNHDPDLLARQPLQPWWGRLVQRSSLRGAVVYHTAMPRKTASVPKRLVAWMLFHALSVVVGVVALRKVDVIVTPSPPLTMGIAAWLLGWWHRAPFLYLVNELYPDIAIALGAVKNRTAIRLLYVLERFVYRRAALILPIANRMHQRLLDKGVPAGKLALLPNFVDADALTPVPAPNALTRELGLDGRFIVSYAGNLGPAQGLGTLLDAAAQLRDLEPVVIVLIGAGSMWDVLERRIREEGHTNVRLVPYLPFARVPEIYGATNLSLVPLAASTGADAVPSKVFRIMACNGAVLAMTDAHSDLAQIVTEAGCGFVVDPGSPDAIAAAIRRAAADPGAVAAMGAGARQLVIERFARPVVMARLSTLLEDVLRRQR
ncbi:MAG: glycosyltransferase family 4 protein [Vicinamibacteraceae bacterium]